jgi:hypothetical protein
MKNIMKFKTWKTIKLGTGLKTGDDFRRALTEAKCHIEKGANMLLDNPSFTVSQKAIEVELVNISVAELGFGKTQRIKEVYLRSQELGLVLCPAEVGPQLLLQYMDESVEYEKFIYIGMEPVAMKKNPDPMYDFRIFAIKHNCRSDLLVSYDATPREPWFHFCRFVFWKRKRHLFCIG